MKTYPTKKDFKEEFNAQTWLINQALDDYLKFTPFCPIARGICTKNCICYEAPNVLAIGTATYAGVNRIYRYYSEYCSNAMLSKEE